MAQSLDYALVRQKKEVRNMAQEKEKNTKKEPENIAEINSEKKSEAEKEKKTSSKKAPKKKTSRRPTEEKVIHDMDEMLIKEHAHVKEANEHAMHKEELHGIKKVRATAREYITAFIAVLIGSVGTVSVMIPNGLTIGGVTGVSRIIQNYTDWNYSLTYYAICLVIMVLVWLELGVKELRKILFMSTAYPVVMFVLEMSKFVLIKSDDRLLISVFCGVLFGICNALTFKAGFSSGGADSLAKVIKYKHFPHLGINSINFAINAAVVMAGAFVFGIDIGLYAVIITYTTMKVGEAVMYGLSNKIVELEIITNNPDELSQFVMQELGRGVSGMEVTGEYTGQKRKDLKILCSPRESFLIKRYLAHHDPKSFVTVTSVSSVWGTGRGFSDIHKVDD